jgi:hypothetical protein
MQFEGSAFARGRRQALQIPRLAERLPSVGMTTQVNGRHGAKDLRGNFIATRVQRVETEWKGCQADPFGFAQGKRLAVHRAWRYRSCWTENVARLFRGEVLANKGLGSEDPSYIAPVQFFGDAFSS